MSLAVTSFLEFVAIFILLTWGIYLVYRVGQLNNGVVFTMSIGAYFSAYVARDLGWPFGLALIGAVAVGALCAFLPALRFARMRAFTMAIATIALIFIGQAVISNLSFLGGIYGFYKIPKVENLLPMAYAAVVIIGFFIYRLEHSRLGRATEVVFTDLDVAASFGIDVYKLRIILQTVAGAISALAGVFYAFSMGTLQVKTFGFSFLLYLYCFLFVGGSTTMWGAVALTPILWSITVFLPGAIAEWKDIIYGTLLIAMLILRPNGLINKEVIRSIRSRPWLRQLGAR